MTFEEVCRPKDAHHAAELIDRLTDRIERDLRGQGHNLEGLRLRTVLEEALLNAWIHGNKQDSRKTVTIRWNIERSLEIEVIDEGEGFDFTCPPDPTDSENITKPGGRGIFIIRYYADRLEWKQQGNHLIVAFETSQGGEPPC